MSIELHHPQIGAFLGDPSEHSHIVSFYACDAALVDNVVAYLAAGLRAGEPVIVIATPAHREAIAGALDAVGLPPTVDRGVTMLDAHDTLADLLVDGEVDATRFAARIGDLIDQALRRSGARRVRAYGEMVDLLWRGGHEDAALALEELWNDLSRRSSFALLCAYVAADVRDVEALRAICDTHSHTICDVTAAGSREVVERIARIIAHELRNPLAMMMMTADYIDRATDDGKVARAARRIITSGDRIDRLIADVLALAEVDLMPPAANDEAPVDR